MTNNYDLIIIGAGPAGLTASLYAARYKINHLVIGDPFAATICEAHLLENFPGFEKISGIELMTKLSKQVRNYGVEIKTAKVVQLAKKVRDLFEVKLNTGEEFSARTLLIASGTERKRLAIPGEKELTGKGVSYCATCDAPFFKNMDVAVIGSGSSAVMAADLAANYAKKVYLIYRSKELKAEPIWLERIKEKSKIVYLSETNIKEIKGKNKVEEIVLDKEYQDKNSLRVGGLIIEVGVEAVSEFLKSIGVELDESGYVKIQASGSTNVSGVFAAGDITTGSNKFRQVITACAEGAVAALGVYNYLKK